MTKTIYFIAPYPIGEAPSQRFRFEQYLELLHKDGFTIETHPFLNQKTWNALYKESSTAAKIFGILGSFWRRFLLLFQLYKADFIFIHREASHVGPPIFEWFIAKILKRKYIYDFDDATWLPNYSESNARFHRLKAYWKVKYCIKWAHVVTAGNVYLQKYALQYNSNTLIIPTTIDLENHHNLKSDHLQNPPIIGWTGTHTTMQYLAALIPILKEVEKSHKFIFRIISNEKPSFKLASLEFVKWKKITEIEDLSQFTIGVMPLVEDQWSAGKCGFKALQYMALEIPTILSPVGVNTTIIQQDENGILAETAEEWRNALIELIERPNLRQKLGIEGRNTIEHQFSVKANYSKYLSLFKTEK